MTEATIANYKGRTAIVADDHASVVVLSKTGEPLALLNLFDHGEGKATVDVILPRKSKGRAMLFSFSTPIERGEMNGRHWLAYTAPDDVMPDDSADVREWGNVHAVINDGPA